MGFERWKSTIIRHFWLLLHPCFVYCKTMASSSSYKENTAPPIISFDTTWSSSSTELKGDAASYHPDEQGEEIILPPPPPLTMSKSTELCLMNTQHQQLIPVSTAAYYQPHHYQYPMDFGGWVDGSSGGFMQHPQHHPMEFFPPAYQQQQQQQHNSYYPQHGFSQNFNYHHPNNHHRLHGGTRLTNKEAKRLLQQQQYLRSAAAPASSPTVDPTPLRSNKSGSSSSLSSSPHDNPKARNLNQIFFLADNTENEEEAAAAAAAAEISSNSAVLATATNNPKKLTDASKDSGKLKQPSKPTILSAIQNEEKGTTAIVTTTTSDRCTLPSSNLHFSPCAAPFTHPSNSALTTPPEDYNYDGVLEPMKSLSMGLYESTSLWSTNPPWAGLFGLTDEIGDDAGVAQHSTMAAANTNQYAPPVMDYAAVARMTNFTEGENDVFSSDCSQQENLLENKPAIDSAPPKKLHPKSVAEYQNEIQYLAEQDPPTASNASEAESLLREMLSKKEGRVENIQPNESCYNSVVLAYRRLRQPRKAESIFRLLMEDQDVEPSCLIYTNVLRAWQKSKDPMAAHHCERILEEMFLVSDSHRYPHCKPSIALVTSVLQCWADSSEEDAAGRAEFLFQQIKSRFLDGDDDFRPEAFCYITVLNAYVQASKMEEAEAMMWEIVDDFLGGVLAKQPATRDFNNLLSMYVRVGTEEAVKHAECVVARFRELHQTRLLSLKPDGYTAVWLKLLLKKWEGEKDKSPAANLQWLSKLCLSIDPVLLPNTGLYQSLIESHVSRGDRDVARELFSMMIDEAMAGNKRVQPDNRIFELLISAYVGELCSNHNKRPDPRTAESIMRRVLYLSEQSKQYSHLSPRIATYDTLIMAHCKDNNAKRADDLLWEIVNKKLGFPRKALLETVEDTWKKSRHPDKNRQLKFVQCFITKQYGNGKHQQPNKRA